MKKILLAVAVLTALVSCSKETVVDVNRGKNISFRTSLDNSLTRTNQIGLNNLKAFKVTAIGNGTSYFDDMKVTYSNDEQTWKTEYSYPWVDYTLAFFAYAPGDVSGVSISNASKTITGFTPARAVDRQKDLIIAYNTGDREHNESNGVSLNFKHALAQIEIRAKCPNEKVKIEVAGVKIVNAFTSADFTFPETQTTTDYTLGEQQWSNLNGGNKPDSAYVIKNTAAPVRLDNVPKSIMFGDNNFMLLPQQLTAWDGTTDATGAYISVLCRISTLNGATETQLYPPKAGLYGFTAVAIDTKWEAGKKYIYTLEFCGDNGGVGKIDPRPTDPTNPTDPAIDPKPGTAGKEILGKPIKFTVTVESWDEIKQNISM
ncbi:MAG TPA: fimbrillin family protein [Candidatus Tidjanibacter gallistercoris]|nr:fimbrillin family protein [Candidatus Tidjanibacter gallistercoris]